MRILVALTTVWPAQRRRRAQPMRRDTFVRLTASVVMGCSAAVAAQVFFYLFGSTSRGITAEQIVNLLLLSPDKHVKDVLLEFLSYFALGAISSLITPIRLDRRKYGVIQPVLFGITCTLIAHFLLPIGILFTAPFTSKHFDPAKYFEIFLDPVEVISKSFMVGALSIAFAGWITFPVGAAGGFLVYLILRVRDICSRRSGDRGSE